MVEEMKCLLYVQMYKLFFISHTLINVVQVILRAPLLGMRPLIQVSAVQVSAN